MDEKKANSGIGFLGALTLVFVVAKILGYITFSWWLVFLPVIAPATLGILLVAIGLIISHRD